LIFISSINLGAFWEMRSFSPMSKSSNTVSIKIL